MSIAGLSIASIMAAMAWVVVSLGTGAFATEIGTWYRALHKPRWQPPDWLFAPAWTVIFAMAAIAAALAWNAATATPVSRTILLYTYALNGSLNTLWSVLFFTMRRPDWALREIPTLWCSIVLMIGAVVPVAARAAWLLLPYVLWVLFAGLLNRAIIRLNH